MSFNLCDLPPEDKALIEVDKAWKERNGKLPTAELDSSAFTGHQLDGVHQDTGEVPSHEELTEYERCQAIY